MENAPAAPRSTRVALSLHKVANAPLKPLGLELSRTRGRNDMRHALGWLRDHRIPVTTVLDVGASDGRWTEMCAEYFPQASYVLYEPQPIHEAALAAFPGRVPYRATVVGKAVGREPGVTYFDVSDPLGGALSSEQTSDTMAVDMTSIDVSVDEVGAAGPFLLKLDTHGFERSILDGAAATLPQCTALIIEAYNYRITDEAMLFYELCAYLDERGFRPVNVVDVMHRAYDASLWQFDMVFVRSDWPGFGHVAFE
jgi:FkbM family methyltransferase